MRGKSAGNGALAAIGLLSALFVLAPQGSLWGQEPEQELSDRSVALLMHYAWQLTPNTYVTPQGKTIEVDKSDRASATVPTDTAREVIRAARMSAQAQICGLPEEELANFQTLMRREQKKGTWSEQQMLYINQLHLFTVMALTGKITAADAAKGIAPRKGVEKPAATCSESERKRVRERIMAYLKADPPAAPLEGRK
jgi:hypothetical protein